MRPARLLGLFALLTVFSIAISLSGVPHPPAGTDQGAVLDPTGRPVTGARVLRLDSQVSRLCPDPSVGSMENLYLPAGKTTAPSTGGERTAEPGWSTATDAGGRFRIPPPLAGSRSEVYLVTAEGFAPRLGTLEPGSDSRMTLERGNDLVIHLLTDHEEPAGDGQATLVPLSICEAVVGALPELLIRSARTDPDGTVEFRQVPDGVYALRVTAKERASSNLAPLLVGEGRSEFRVRLPQATSFKAALDFPPRATRSPGTVVAFWEDPAGVPQWAEGRFSSGESSFELDGLPSSGPVSFSLLARTEEGLSSRWVGDQEIGGSRLGPEKAIPLRLPGSWEGRLEEGEKASSLLVEPLFPASALPLIRTEVVTVQVAPDGRFVVPGVPPAAERLRIVAPGRGEAEVRLEEGAGFNLGVVKIQPRRIIEGIVAWEDGTLLGSTEIEVLSAGRILCRTHTTSEGKFACTSGDSDLRRLQFRALSAGAVLGIAPPPGNPSGPLVLSSGGSLRLRVTRPGGGAPVRDLQFDLGPSRDDAASGRRSGRGVRFSHSRNGTFTLHTAEEGPARITVSVPGGGPKRSATVNVSSSGPPADAALVLPEGAAVFGKVLAGDTREPIAGAEVEIGPGSLYLEHAEVARVLHTPADGTWRFDELREGIVRLSASAPGYSPAAKGASVPAETNGMSQDLLLPRPGKLQVKVLNLPEKSKASLSVLSKTWWIGWNNYRGDLDSHGQLAFENVRPDRYELFLSVKASASARLSRFADAQVRPGETTEVEFDLRKGILLTGRAFLGDKAIPGAKIVLSRYSRTKLLSSTDSVAVDEEGRYSVLLPSAGRYMVYMVQPPPKNRGQMVNLGRLLEIGAENRQSHDLRFEDGRIRGRVLDPGGRPIPDAQILVWNARSVVDTAEGEEKLSEDYGETNETGSFESGPLSSGDYTLQVFAGGFAKRKTDSIPLGPDQILDLPDIVLEPELPFRVKAIDPQGFPVAEVSIMACLPPGFTVDFAAGYGKTGTTGEADMKGLSPGTYNLIALLRGWPPAIATEVKLPLEEGTPAPILQLAPGGGLEIRVTDRSGSAVPDLLPRIVDAEGRDMTAIYESLADMVKSPWQTDGEGRARLAAVAPGEYSIQVGSGKNSDTRRVTISAGQTSRLTLVIPEAEAP